MQGTKVNRHTKEEKKINTVKVEKKAKDSISNHSEIIKFEYGAECPSPEDYGQVLNNKEDKPKLKNVKNFLVTKISRTSLINEPMSSN